MAGFTSALAKTAHYAGLGQIFEFVNADGRLTKWNCGQAAAATLLTQLGAIPFPTDGASTLLGALERRFPPDIFGGWFGTSRSRVIAICRSHGLRLKEVRGESQLRDELTRGNPVVVMLGVSAGRLWNWDLPGGHWMVAYGFDDAAVYLTNWTAPMPWDEFRQRWRSPVTRLIRMGGLGLAASE